MLRNIQPSSNCRIDSDNYLICDCGRRYHSSKHLPIRCPCGTKVGLPEAIQQPHNKFQNPNGYYGFVSVVYKSIGGTETWYHSLLPKLKNVAGFVTLDGIDADGDFSKLNCPYDTGIVAAKQLAKSCKVLVVWCVGDAIYEIIKDTNCKVISMCHSDGTNSWTKVNLQAQAPKTDAIVTVCKTSDNVLPKGIPVFHIPNAPDPNKLIVTEKLRKPLNKKVALICSRISHEKNIGRLVAIFRKHLQEDWQLWIVGARKTDNQRFQSKDNIRVFPATSFPGNYYAVADLVVSASKEEGYGLTMAEALLAGLPVVSTPVGLFEQKPHLATIVKHNASDEEWVDAIRSAKPKPTDDLDRIEDFINNWQNLLDSMIQ